MRRLRGATLVGLIAAVLLFVTGAAAQAAKPAKPAPKQAAASTGKLSSSQSAALKLGWDNILRGYADLLSTPPDVKGDTSRLEPHLKVAMELLHQIDPAHCGAAPSNIPVE